jgi:hypothetical protein
MKHKLITVIYGKSVENCKKAVKQFIIALPASG